MVSGFMLQGRTEWRSRPSALQVRLHVFGGGSRLFRCLPRNLRLPGDSSSSRSQSPEGGVPLVSGCFACAYNNAPRCNQYAEGRPICSYGSCPAIAHTHLTMGIDRPILARSLTDRLQAKEAVQPVAETLARKSNCSCALVVFLE